MARKRKKPARSSREILKQQVTPEQIEQFRTTLSRDDWQKARKLCLLLGIDYKATKSGEHEEYNHGGGRMLRVISGCALEQLIPVVTSNRGYKLAKSKAEVRECLASMKSSIQSWQSRYDWLEAAGEFATDLEDDDDEPTRGTA